MATPAGEVEPDPRYTIRWSAPTITRIGALGAIVLVALASTFLRQDGVAKARTIWAEDGAVFAACVYERSALTCVAEPYAGYYHLVPRLGAAVVPLGDPHDLPYRLTLVSALIVAAAALLAGRAVGEATGSWAAGLLAGSSIALAYPAGREVIGNLANLHWILFSASCTVLVCSWLGRRVGLADMGLVVATVLSSPFAPLVALLALGGVVRRTPRAGMVALAAALASLPQVVSMLTSERAGTPAPALTAQAVLESLAVAGWQSWFGPAASAAKVVAFMSVMGLGVVLVASLAMYLRRDSRDGRWVAVALVALLGTALVTTLMSLVWNGVLVPRHMEPAAALSVAAIAVGAGVVARGPQGPTNEPGPRAPLDLSAVPRLLPIAFCVAFGVGFASIFRLTALASPGPDVAAEIAASREQCLGGVSAISVPISPSMEPPAWAIVIPCREFNLEDLPAA